MLIEFLLVLALILVNGLLAGAEIAIVAVRPGRIEDLAAGGSRAARAVQRLRADSESFLATVQVGITCVGAAAAAFGGATFADRLAPSIARIPALADYAEAIALIVVVVCISYLSVVVGELVPKSLALRVSDRYALLAGTPLWMLSRIMRPAVWFLAASSNLLLRPFSDSTTFKEGRITLDEMRHMVAEASRDGAIDPSTSDLTSRAFDFAALTAWDVMVHRKFVLALPLDATPEELKKAVLGGGHQRIPIFDGTIDHVVGYIWWRDVLARMWEGVSPSIADLMRPPYLVPESRKASDLLAEMREQRIHLAIALDEHGGLAGIVTLEDLLEELVGEIVSEHGAEPPEPVHQADGVRVFSGTTSIRDVERAFDRDLLAPPVSFSTVGGWCVELAGDRFPQVGEVFEAECFRLEILDVTPRRVRSVAISLLPEPAPKA